MNFLNNLYPPKCIFCGVSMPLSAEHGVPCETCLSTLPLLREPRVNAIPGLVCLAPMKYEARVRQGLHGLKFHSRITGARYFARLMVQCLRRYALTGFDAVTWVPVSRARERKRGYDQSELLAQEVAKIIGMKPRKLIIKSKNTRPNSMLKSEEARRENVEGAFRLAPFAKVGDKILLVDDVITTGSTAAACAEVLTLCGAKEIVVLAVAAAR